MRRIGVNLADKAQTEAIDKARAKRGRRDATRKQKGSSDAVATDGETTSVAEAIRDMAHEAVTTVEEMVATASDKIKDMVAGSPAVTAATKKTARRERPSR